MALPFLDRKRIASTVLERRGKPGSVSVAEEDQRNDGEGDDSSGLQGSASDLLAAIERKSVVDVARSFKALFDLCESMPHEENNAEPEEGSEE